MAKSHLNVVRITELQFMDDLTQDTSIQDKLKNVTGGFVKEISRYRD